MHYLQRICCRSPKPYLRLADVKSYHTRHCFFCLFFSGGLGFRWRNWMLVVVEMGNFYIHIFMKNCVSQAKKAWRLPWKSMNSEEMRNDLELNRSSSRCQYWKNRSSCIFDRAVLNFHSSDFWCRLATGAKNSTHTSPLPRIGKSGFDKTWMGRWVGLSRMLPFNHDGFMDQLAPQHKTSVFFTPVTMCCMYHFPLMNTHDNLTWAMPAKDRVDSVLAKRWKQKMQPWHSWQG